MGFLLFEVVGRGARRCAGSRILNHNASTEGSRQQIRLGRSLGTRKIRRSFEPGLKPDEPPAMSTRSSRAPHVRGKWSWKCGNSGSAGPSAFPAGRLEMTSSSLVEIRHSAISTHPPFPPPYGGPARPEHGRPAQAVEARDDHGASCGRYISK